MRSLTDEEIENILSFIKPNKNIPEEIAKNIVEKTKKPAREQLKKIKIYEEMIPRLAHQIKEQYLASLIQPGECVGIVTAQSIGEKQTQTNLNTFHKAGSSDKQPVVSKFSELLNATNNPKAPCYFVYFNKGNDSISNLRDTIGDTIVHLTLKKITKKFEICVDKEREDWFDIFEKLYEEKPEHFRDCVQLEINMGVLFEYKISMPEIAKIIKNEYDDAFCMFSPDCFGKILVFFDTDQIELPEEKLVFVTQENAREIYLEEVAQPILETLTIGGIPGIENMYFVQDKKEWLIETENSREKSMMKKIKFKENEKKTKEKKTHNVKRFKKVLAHPDVDYTRTLSNNIWDIYHTFGIESARQYMIDEFSKIMEGINISHIMILVEKMTFNGIISSISRYTMRREESGPLGKASFEETQDNLLNAGIYGPKENTQGVSASIICGKKAPIGTGLCQLSMDIDKITKFWEDRNRENFNSKINSEIPTDESQQSST